MYPEATAVLPVETSLHVVWVPRRIWITEHLPKRPVLMCIRWSQMVLWFSEFNYVLVLHPGDDSRQDKNYSRNIYRKCSQEKLHLFEHIQLIQLKISKQMRCLAVWQEIIKTYTVFYGFCWLYFTRKTTSVRIFVSKGGYTSNLMMHLMTCGMQLKAERCVGPCWTVYATQCQAHQPAAWPSLVPMTRRQLMMMTHAVSPQVTNVTFSKLHFVSSKTSTFSLFPLKKYRFRHRFKGISLAWVWEKKPKCYPALLWGWLLLKRSAWLLQ